MRLRDVTFDAWLRSHGDKDPEERWLRELYPWPVLAQVDCDKQKVGQIQKISYDDVDYNVTLQSRHLQPTYRHRLRVADIFERANEIDPAKFTCMDSPRRGPHSTARG